MAKHKKRGKQKKERATTPPAVQQPENPDGPAPTVDQPGIWTGYLPGEDGDPDYHLRATSPLSTNASEAPSFERAKLGRTTPDDMSKCTICLASIPSRNRQRHLASAHGIDADWESVTPDTPRTLGNRQTREQLVQCPECKQSVKRVNIRRHMEKVHGKVWRDGGRQLKADERVTPSGKLLIEALTQSHDEPRDGSKYIGHVRREFGGRFGSMPLYDDYGDEADAD